MPIISELSSYIPSKDTLITIGVFDGVHLGHQHLLGRLTDLAAQRNLSSGVITFSRHPRNVLAHQARLPRLTTPDERNSLLRSLGIDFVIPLTFNEKVAALSAREFVLLLKKHLRMAGLVIGPDFALGHKREGNAATLQKLGKELGFSVDIVEPFTVGVDMPSSTAIRKALSQGDVSTVSRLLGRCFSLSGLVVSGVERGQVLGFRTANLHVDADHALPADGVYATRAYVHDKKYQSVTNIGIRPTFNEEGRSIEVHILDFSEDLYGQLLTIDIVERLRGEVKFGSPHDLIVQIGKDVQRARQILASLNGVHCDRPKS